LKQFSKVGGSSAIAIAVTYPISWNESPVYQRIYADDEDEAAVPERAVAEATELLHDDFAYEFEVEWELWSPAGQGDLDPVWRLEPHRVSITGFGPEFDEGSYEQNGHIRIDLGQDSVFLQDEVELDQESAAHVQQNVQRLIDFTNQIEQNIGISSRLLWSESGENLAQKLIARLQRLN
jgi:hypothetical protein